MLKTVEIKNLARWVVIVLSCLMILGVSLNAQETIIYSTDFESDNGGFTHSGVIDEWEWGMPVFGVGVTAHSGTKIWVS